MEHFENFSFKVILTEDLRLFEMIANYWKIIFPQLKRSEVLSLETSFYITSAVRGCCAFSSWSLTRALITLLIKDECWASLLTDDESSSNLNLFGEGSEEDEEVSLRLFEDADDGGPLIGGITNWGTGFKVWMLCCMLCCWACCSFKACTFRFMILQKGTWHTVWRQNFEW